MSIKYYKKIKKLNVNKLPRLCIFKSNKYIYAQIIDDYNKKTLTSYSSIRFNKIDKNISKLQISNQVGVVIAKKALDLGIKKVVFDRGKYRYHGKVKSFCEGARKNGLIF